jgi:hypothetical protein
MARTLEERAIKKFILEEAFPIIQILLMDFAPLNIYISNGSVT